MIRSGLRSITLVSLPLLAIGCFEDVGGDDTTGDGDADTTGDGDPTGDGDGDPTGDGDGDPTGDGDGDPTGDGDGDPTGDGDGDSDPVGPQLVDSQPAADDPNAGLEPYFLLYFDRVIDDGDATGKVFVSQAGADPVPVTIMPCPSLDPTCIAGLYPMDLVTAEGKLPAATEHQITISAGFEDTDGIATEADQVLDFTTFAYNPNFFDDSALLGNETGGLSYDPGTNALFLVGVNDSLFDGPRVRRIPLNNGAPGAATTIWEYEPVGGGPWTYGLDSYGGNLFVSATYSGEVIVLGALQAMQATVINNISGTTLAAPHDDLEEVWSVARGQGGRMFFSWGEFNGGVNGTGVVEFSAGNWSMFNNGLNLWDTGEVMITVGQVGGTEFLFAASEGTVYKFRTADGMLAATYELEENDDFSFDLEVDSQGLLWYGGQSSGVYAFDVSNNAEIVTVAKRSGIRCGRMALRETIDVTHVYCVGFRDDAIVSHLPIPTP